MQNEFTFIFPTISIIDPSCISDKPKDTIENTLKIIIVEGEILQNTYLKEEGKIVQNSKAFDRE